MIPAARSLQFGALALGDVRYTRGVTFTPRRVSGRKKAAPPSANDNVCNGRGFGGSGPSESVSGITRTYAAFECTVVRMAGEFSKPIDRRVPDDLFDPHSGRPVAPFYILLYHNVHDGTDPTHSEN